MNEEQAIGPLKLAVSLSQKVNLGNYETADCSLFVSGITSFSTEEEIAELVEQGKLAYTLMAKRLTAMVQAQRVDTVSATVAPTAVSPREDDEEDKNPACPDCGASTEYKTGTAKNGKPWAGYFCLATKNADRNHKHGIVWV